MILPEERGVNYGATAGNMLMKTYTAGEDAGRLASAAKEFGLERPRDPKPNVRHERVRSLSTLNTSALMVRAFTVV